MKMKNNHKLEEREGKSYKPGQQRKMKNFILKDEDEETQDE